MAASRRKAGAKIMGEVSKKALGGDEWVTFENVFQERKSGKEVAAPAEQLAPRYSGIPIHISHVADYDDVSDVSNVSNSTPFSVVDDHVSLFVGVDSVKGHGKCLDANLASAAAIYLKQVVNDVVDNVTSSIDPNVIVEFQGRTRSLVSRSFGLVRNMKSRRAKKESASELVGSGGKPATPEVQHPRPSAVPKFGSRDKKSRVFPLRALNACLTSPTIDRQYGRCYNNNKASERCGVEVSSEGRILDIGLLGDEIEISRYHHDSLLLDSRDMYTEITFFEEEDEQDAHDSESVLTEIVTHEVSKQPLDHRRKLVVPRFFRMKTKEHPPTPPSTRVHGKHELHDGELVRSSPRSSGKTVSTMNSDESTTAMHSMHTDESGWLQDTAIERILQC
jgi:hypothetical protein